MNNDYKKARDLSWQILRREKICALPVDVVEICRRLKIKVVRMPNARPEDDGYSVLIDGVPHICINTDMPHERRRFTIAHELGHILLGHVGEWDPRTRGKATKNDPEERAANIFAARILAPACVLWGCKVSSAAEIAALCDISATAAGIRWERMQILYARGQFLKSSLERKVYRQFKGYIKEYLKR